MNIHTEIGQPSRPVKGHPFSRPQVFIDDPSGQLDISVLPERGRGVVFHRASLFRKEGKKVGQGACILSSLHGRDHLFFRFTQSDNEMDANLMSSEDLDGPFDYVPVMIPAVGPGDPCSSQLIKEVGGGCINGNSQVVRALVFHGQKGAVVMDKRGADENTDEEIRLFFEPADDRTGIL